MGSRGLLAALLVVLLCRVDARPTSRSLMQEFETTVAGKSLILHGRFQGGGELRSLVLQAGNGQHLVVRVDDPSQIEGLQSGMDLVVKGVWSGAASTTINTADQSSSVSSLPLTFRATSWTASGGLTQPDPVETPGRSRSKMGAGNSGPAGANTVSAAASAAVSLNANPLMASSLRVAVIPIAADGCTGQYSSIVGKQPVSVTGLRRVLLEDANPTGPTVASTFRRCSYGRTQLAAGSQVYNPVKLPCTGTLRNLTWRTWSCTEPDLFGFAAAADEELRKRNTVPANGTHRVYMLPPGVCPELVAIGMVGCANKPDTVCRAWVGPNNWNNAQAIAHELSHNLYLGHAGDAAQYDQYAREYNDYSCVMGYSDSDRCWNTPHAWQLGWVTVQQFTGANLAAGQTVTVSLASQSSSARSGLRIVPTWAPTAPPIFVGFRTAIGGDRDLRPDFVRRVTIYTANITSRFTAAGSKLQGTLGGPGASWAHLEAGVVVKLRSAGVASATVTVCRKDAAGSC